MLRTALNTAARFNDRVILLLFGGELTFDVLPNVEIFQVATMSLVDEPTSIARWLALLRFAETNYLPHMFVANIDVLVLSNITADAAQCYSRCNTFGASPRAAYFQLAALREFIQSKVNGNANVMDVYFELGANCTLRLHQAFSHENAWEQEKETGMVLWRQPGSLPRLVQVLQFAESDKVLCPAATVSDNALLRPKIRAKSENSFHCLEDTPMLWEERRAIRDAHRQKYCQPSKRRVGDMKSSVVPIVFVFWVASPSVLTKSTFRMLALALNTAAKFNNRVLLLLFGRRTDMQFDVLPNVEIREVVMDQSDPLYMALKSFDQPLYHHMSVNTVEYELYCFQRWFALQRWMELEHLEHVFVADNDILLLTNVTADVEQCYSGCDTVGAFVYSTYFTYQALSQFTRYILDVYRDQASSERLHAIQREFGLISDMILHRQFIIETKAACSAFAFVSQQGLVPSFAYMGHFYDYAFDQDQAGLVSLHLPGYTPLLAQVLHFQGERKNVMIKCPSIKTP